MKQLAYFFAFAALATNISLDASEEQSDQPGDASKQIEDQPDAMTRTLISDFHEAERLKGELQFLRELKEMDQKVQNRLEDGLAKIKSADTTRNDRASSIEKERLVKLESEFQQQIETLKQSIKRRNNGIERVTSALQKLAAKRTEFERTVRENPTKENLVRKTALLEAEIEYLSKRNERLRKKYQELVQENQALEREKRKPKIKR